ncbi:hypothetical protein TrVE_jg5636 [Triparma verrucosa]|nr:hypothetical protein TrVE_jg5636 [Triparma verrucosa]
MLKGEEGERTCVENGVEYSLRVGDGFSVGLFLDTSLLREYVKGLEGRCLNLFSHGNAIAKAKGGEGVNVDLSEKYFQRVEGWKNIVDDVWDYCKRKGGKESFDVVVCDPPSSSVGKKRRWSTLKDYPELITLLTPLVSSSGLLILCSNTKKQSRNEFLKQCEKGFEMAGRKGVLERVLGTEWGWWTEGVKIFVWRLE